MYGKHFKSMYTGSMYGAGPAVFAVWGYAISNASINGEVELNGKLIAAVIGMSEKEVNEALSFLQKPDEESRNSSHEGRRLVKNGQFQYFIPTYEYYRKIIDEESRREYNKQKKREERARKKSNDVKSVKPCQQMSAASAHVEVEVDVEEEVKKKENTKVFSRPNGRDSFQWVLFDKFWKAYPKKIGVEASKAVWKKIKPTSPQVDQFIAAIENQKKSESWVGGFIPAPAKWLSEGRWSDEIKLSWRHSDDKRSDGSSDTDPF